MSGYRASQFTQSRDHTRFPRSAPPAAWTHISSRGPVAVLALSVGGPGCCLLQRPEGGGESTGVRVY